MDRRTRAAHPDRRLHGSRRRHARGPRSADGTRAASQGRRRPRLRRARQSRSDESDRRLARRDGRDLTRPSPTPTPRSGGSGPGTSTRSSQRPRRTRASRCRPSTRKPARRGWPLTLSGYVEYKEALAPRGKYGAWLRGKPIVTVVDGNIFMHAGIPPGNAPAKIDDLNIAESGRDPQAGSVPRSPDQPQARHA